MYKHPISAFFRLLPALGWVVACVVAVVMPARLYIYVYSEGRWSDPAKAWPEAVFLLGFVAVAIYAARMAHKEYKEALPALRADTPITLGPLMPRRPPQITLTRYPLSETLRAEVRQLLETLHGAGMLQPGEVTIDELIDCAEMIDEWSEVDLYMAMVVLHALGRERERVFANIAFFAADVETDATDAVKIMQELARLCGRSQELSAVRVRSVSGGPIVTADSAALAPNVVAEFDLGVEHHTIPFVLHHKNIPSELFEALAKILVRSDDPRRFVWDNFDSFFSVSYLTPAQTAAINGAEQQEFPRFVAV